MMFHASAAGRLNGAGLDVRCALGAGGIAAPGAKREGDGRTPAGLWPLRRVLYRPDRLPAPRTGLPVSPLAADDGWCDAPGDPAYNRAVKHPYPASAERLWRADHIYDIVVVLGFNDDPVTPGAGSAIFWHLAHDDYRPTAGCVAIAREHMLTALAAVGPGDALEITA
jgi:L,D-peptidoglycan transpeptidase YkuD (ErfK/YbiS/YcfS/YnhG family)